MVYFYLLNPYDKRGGGGGVSILLTLTNKGVGGSEKVKIILTLLMDSRLLHSSLFKLFHTFIWFRVVISFQLSTLTSPNLRYLDKFIVKEMNACCTTGFLVR